MSNKIYTQDQMSRFIADLKAKFTKYNGRINGTKIKLYKFEDVFDLDNSLVKSTNYYAEHSYVELILNSDETEGLMSFAIYLGQSVAQSTTGFKSNFLVYKPTFPYVHKREWSPMNNTYDLGRSVATMWDGSKYVNTVVTFYSTRENYTYQEDRIIKGYYTNEMLNKTGGFNIQIANLPIEKKPTA